MPLYGSPNIFYFAGGRSLMAAKAKGLSRKISAEHEDTTGIGDTIVATQPTGVSSIDLSQTGAYFETSAMHAFFGDVADSVQEVADVVCAGFGGDTIGQPFAGYEGVYKAEYEVISQPKNLTKANTKFAFNGALDEGVILHPLATRTTDTNGTTVDQTASSASGGVGFVQITALSGFTGVLVKVQHSTDGATWADRLSFTNVTSAPAAQRVTVSGTVNRYVRALVDVTGVGSVTVWVGFKRS